MPQFDVTVAGELNLDLILYGLPEELEPEREHLAGGMSLTLGSSSAIFAHNLSSLGSRVGFIARIGDDCLGRMAIERLSDGGVDVSRVREVAGPTKSGLTVILTRPAYRNILTYPGTMSELCFEDLDLEYLASSRHFHLSSYFLHRALRPRIADLFKTMKDAGLTTSLDTNDDPEDLWDEDCLKLLRHVDVFLPNGREACKVAREADFETAAGKLSRMVPTLVVKLGSEGAVTIQNGKKIAAPACKVNAVDPVGAGDSFDAGFLHMFVRGADLRTCLAFGNLTGALSTTRPGGTEAFRDQALLKEFMHRNASGLSW